MEREDTDGSSSMEVETDSFGAKTGNILINCQEREFFCFDVFNLCVVPVLFSTVPFLLHSDVESLDTVIQLSVNDPRA